MGNGNPYSFYVVLADGIIEIPQDSNLSWITPFYALPRELVEKRPAYLELPRNIYQLLHSEKYRKLIQSDSFLELVWDCYAWAAWQFFQVPAKGGNVSFHPWRLVELFRRFPTLAAFLRNHQALSEEV